MLQTALAATGPREKSRAPARTQRNASIVAPLYARIVYAPLIAKRIICFPMAFIIWAHEVRDAVLQ